MFHPQLHDFNLGLLVGDDFLRQPAKRWIRTAYQLRPGHVDGRLMMREHQCSEINIAVSGWLDRRHRPMHPLHARVKLGPAAIVCPNLTRERVNAVLKGLGSDRTARQQQNCYSQCDPHSDLRDYFSTRVHLIDEGHRY